MRIRNQALKKLAVIAPDRFSVAKDEDIDSIEKIKELLEKLKAMFEFSQTDQFYKQYSLTEQNEYKLALRRAHLFLIKKTRKIFRGVDFVRPQVEPVQEKWYQRYLTLLLPKWLSYILLAVIGVFLIASMRAMNGIAAVFNNLISIFWGPIEAVTLGIGLGFALVGAFVFYCFEVMAIKNALGLDKKEVLEPYFEVMTKELALIAELKKSLFQEGALDETSIEKLELLKLLNENLNYLKNEPWLDYQEPVVNRVLRYLIMAAGSILTATGTFFLVSSFITTILPVALAFVGVTFLGAMTGPFAPLLIVPIVCAVAAVFFYYFTHVEPVYKKMNPLAQTTEVAKNAIEAQQGVKAQKIFEHDSENLVKLVRAEKVKVKKNAKIAVLKARLNELTSGHDLSQSSIFAKPSSFSKQNTDLSKQKHRRKSMSV